MNATTMTRRSAWLATALALGACSKEEAQPAAAGSASASASASAAAAAESAASGSGAGSAAGSGAATGAGSGAATGAGSGAATGAGAATGSGAVTVDPSAGTVAIKSGAGTVTLSLEPTAPAGAALAARCTLEGDPLVAPCVNGSSLAATAGGAIYVTGATGVRRYRRSEGEGCHLALDTGFGKDGVLATPAREPRPQVLGKGPVYMRSGGPDWKLTADGDAVYLHDFLLGLYRVDRGKLQPVCPDLQGVSALAIDGASAVVGRDGGTRLALGKKCKATKLPLEPRPRSGMYAIGGAAWGETGSGTLVRYDRAGKQAAAIGGEDAFAPGGLCSIVAAAPCGDDVCVLDGNCQRMARFDADGGFRLERKAEQLLGDRPYGLSALAPATDGGMWVLATHKDGEACESALYLVPGAAIAP